ncbi:condensation domain-containing protein [Actinoplanes sp. NPDC051859]|uniref:condensation domain-containing protein n=1 Tax=Actinoplanes sp. NPDC051859 TaxID=3363909 RepID=UPI0037B2737E
MTEELYQLPASYGQQRLWLLEQTDPNSSIYSMNVALRLRGPIRPDLLATALTRVVERHEVLRTVIRLHGGEVVQVVRAPEPVPLPVLDVDGGLPGATARAQQWCAEPFDLGQGPLLRCALLRLDADDHILITSMHHSITDGLSLTVMLKDITTSYASLVVGGDGELPELPLQYADYALWQQEHLASGALDPQLDFWTERLADLPPLRLPRDHPAPARPTFDAVTAAVELKGPLIAALREAAPGGGGTPFMATLAAYAAVLARWSRQTDLVVALPIAGRPEPDLEELVGFFVNSLPVRLEVRPEMTFTELLGHVRDRCVAAYSHPDVPFELLVERLRPVRRAGRTPLVQAWLAVLPELPLALGDIPGVALDPVLLNHAQAPFDLVADLLEDGDLVHGQLLGRADLFTAQTVELVARSLAEVLSAAAADPGVTVADLPVVVADERVPSPYDTDEEPELPPPPSTAVVVDDAAEALLRRLWSEVLDRPDVGPDEEFYALGGTSLSAVRVVMEARRHGLELPLEVMLGEHTVRHLLNALPQPVPHS